MTEHWLPVPEYEGYYEVSDLGCVRSLGRVVPSTARGGRRRVHSRILRPRLNRDGYPIVTLTRYAASKLVPVHKLVALAFHGDKRSALHAEVSHLDGARTNASADNLKWASERENEAHKRIHGTYQAGELNPRARLTAEQVQEIRLATMGRHALASAYGMSVRTVDDIRSFRRWRHLPVPQDCQARADRHRPYHTANSPIIPTPPKVQ